MRCEYGCQRVNDGTALEWPLYLTVQAGMLRSDANAGGTLIEHSPKYDITYFVSRPADILPSVAS